jgi:hypothetical protein
MSLTPDGEHSTRLSLAGAYRPPLPALGAGLDKAIFQTVADATVRSLLARVADALSCPQESTGAVQKSGVTGPAAHKGQRPKRLSPAVGRGARADGDRRSRA